MFASNYRYFNRKYLNETNLCDLNFYCISNDVGLVEQE